MDLRESFAATFRAADMNKAIFFLLALSGTFSMAQAQDATAGRNKAAMCIGCHGIPGYQASFPEVHKVPMISGQSAKYIIAALFCLCSAILVFRWHS